MREGKDRQRPDLGDPTMHVCLVEAHRWAFPTLCPIFSKSSPSSFSFLRGLLSLGSTSFAGSVWHPQGSRQEIEVRRERERAIGLMVGDAS